jgi:hypothetical protein
MNFTSQICTTEEQSKRLLALGLKKETADCYLEYVGKDNYGNNVWHSSTIVNNYRTPDYSRDFPAWSLHRLMEMVPFNLKDKKGYIYDFVIEDNNTISYYYFDEHSWYCNKYWAKNNLYDNFIDCIEWLINKGYFNKEYLN